MVTALVTAGLAIVPFTSTAAAAEILSPAGGDYLNGIVTVTWERESDDDSYIELTLFASGTELHPKLCENCPGSAFTFDTRDYADGREYVLMVQESAGSPGKPPRETTSGTFTIDNTAPVTQSVLEGADGANGWFLGDVTVELVAEDETAGVDHTLVSVDGGAFTAYSGSFRVTGDGAHDVAFRSVDRAGNVEATRSVSFTIDTIAPASTITLDAPSVDEERVTYVTSDTQFTLDASDATSGVDRIEYRVNGGAFTTYEGAFAVTGEDGEQRVEWRAVDAAGNVETPQYLRVFLDNAAPDLSVARPLAGGAYADDTAAVETTPVHAEADDFGLTHDGVTADTFRFAVTTGNLTLRADTADAAAGVRDVTFLVDGEVRAVITDAPFEWTWDTRGEVAGEHVVTVVSTDRLGNAAVESIEVEVVPASAEGVEATVDNGGPVLPAYFFEKLAALAGPLPEGAPETPAELGELLP